MSRHSRHNTHLAYFTNHERSQLNYGTQRRRLGQDSYRSFDACHLCLSPAVNPIACEKGDLFCRECAIENLLAQKQEIKEAQRLEGIAAAAEAHQNASYDAESQSLQVAEFERVQAGMQQPGQTSVAPKTAKQEAEPTRTPLLIEAAPEVESSTTGSKRKFNVDQDEYRRIADADYEKHKQALVRSKDMNKGSGSGFWLPEEVPDDQARDRQMLKATPVCPASDVHNSHGFSLKSFVTVNFDESEDLKRICPSCRKQLSNVIGGTYVRFLIRDVRGADKSRLLVTCGHVVCRVCMDRFLKDDGRCCICSRSFASSIVGDKLKKSKPARGIIELRQEGTGYASKRDAVVKRAGVAFQG